ncbi:MAG: riboflavin synthase alpha chain [Pseudomonadota bacterium]|jgi:riboflavin synthase
MYSGITQGLFIVKLLIKRPGLFHYSVVLNKELAKNLKLGSSVSIDGVCQTVVAIHGYEVSFDAMQETLAKTTLNELFIGRKVSVERSIGFGDEIGGHELSGHIFETGIVIDKKINAENLCLSIQTSGSCFAFIKPKGYIAVDGSSLTVGLTDKKQHSFEVHLIPETLRKTNFSNKNIGDKVNIEPDMKTMLLVETVQNYFANIDDRLTAIEKKLQQIATKQH